MNDGYLRLSEPQRERGVQVAIDLFFRTLADTHHTHAIGIVLSGSGADGSVGLSRIKEQGGITLAQEPGDAEFESMPRSAIETGMVDIVLPVADIAQKLVELRRNMQTLLEQFRPVPAPEDGEHPAVEPGEMDYIQAQPQTKPNELALREILAALRTRTGHDFRHYKLATVLRRIERRMQVNALPDMPSYARYLQGNPEETPALLADMLIGVTNFFRDREAFEALERDIIPVLFEQKLATDDRALRVWAAACSTGEEAYSLAMLLTDQAAHSGVDIQTQLFATDIDDRALETARAGVYPEAIVTDVTPARLRQYFVKDQNQLRLQKELRERILFARHNILRDPPFSRLDLISCRNLMIYLDRDIQIEVLRMFHFALNPGGYLFLGSSETADVCSQLFTAVDKKNRIYRAKEVGSSLRRAPSARCTASPSARRRARRSASRTGATASSPSPTCTSARSSSTRRPASSSTRRRRSCTCPTAPGTSCAMSVASPH